MGERRTGFILSFAVVLTLVGEERREGGEGGSE